jgi:galactokinase
MMCVDDLLNEEKQMALPDLVKKLHASYLRAFGGDGGRKITFMAAPSRATLLGGEYSEAADGLSLTTTGNHWVVVAAQRRNDRQIIIHSSNYDERLSFAQGSLKFDRGDGWANYPKGVAYYYERTGRKIEGLSLAIAGDIPEDCGLGSSAALCVATGLALNQLGNQPLDDATLVKLCQRVEHQFMGLRGDYTSPFASRFGKDHHLVLFDSRTFKPEYVPFDYDAYKFVVAESGIRKREAADEFAKRLALLQQLLTEIRKHVPKVVSLRDVTPEAYEPARKNLDILLRKRLDHVVYENSRVRRAKDLLVKGDYAGFGGVLSESHESLADRFKVTCPEVDLLYSVGRAIPGFLGGRMAGIGFGGHVVFLVKASESETFMDRLKRDFNSQARISPKVFLYGAGEGAREVESSVGPGALG